MSGKIHSRSTLRNNRKSLRNNLTPAEATLWNHLKNRQLLNRKFTRQHSISNFIADFYCAEEQLIVELDGQPHFEPGAAERDHERTLLLNELGITVIRFENKLVFQNILGVLDLIASNFKSSGTQNE